MSHYVKANGKSVIPSRGVAIEGWKPVRQKGRHVSRWHLFFVDGTTGCRATTKLEPLEGVGASDSASGANQCAFCVDVDERYKREAGVELYAALDRILKTKESKFLTEFVQLEGLRALNLARNK